MTRQQATNEFLRLLQEESAAFEKLVSTEDGDWIVKGFIDVFKNVYTISADTKVVSKLIELMLFPYFLKFADKHGYKVVLSREQNHYPDLTFVTADEYKFAVDLKSTYRVSTNVVNSMTLDAFTGYFRNPVDDRPRKALESARAWQQGEITISDARTAAFAAHAAAPMRAGRPGLQSGG